MKKRTKAILAATVAGVLLAACGSSPGKSVSSGEIVAPEMSSEDLLVSSLEYLLEEEDGTSKEQEAEDNGVSGNGGLQDDSEDLQAEDLSSQTESTESGAGSLDAQSGNTASQAGGLELDAGETAENPGQDGENPETEPVVIYYGKGGSLELIRETAEIGELTPDGLIDALARHNIVPLLDTKVLSFEIVEEDGKKIVCLNLSKAFGEYLRTMSKEAECIIVASITDTFLENYGADALRLMVDGEAVSTENGEYGGALEKCTPDELMEAGNASE